MANPDHVNQIRQGTDVWNQWRRSQPDGLNIDLSGEGFSDIDLRGAELESANLSHAVLNDATLTGADLSGANLSGAILSDATVSQADLIDANFSGADLSGASLEWSNLSGADLSHTTLTGANLANADLSKATLNGANLTQANLTNANLRNATFIYADLNAANFAGAYFGDDLIDLQRSQETAFRDIYTDFSQAQNYDQALNLTYTPILYEVVPARDAIFTEPFGGGRFNRFQTRNLNLEQQGNRVAKRAGGQFQVTLEVLHDCPECGGAINQIIVGLGGEEKAQTCVWIGGQSSGGWQSVSFTLTVPNTPGIYYVRTRYAQAYTEFDALSWWKVDRPNGPSSGANLGYVRVLG
jgi:uncharacterized protein YjbI with pentapeptide repeats